MAQFPRNRQFSEDSWESILSDTDSVPRLSLAGSNISQTSIENQNSNFREAIEFLHQDKEFLVAAELGNERLLEIYIRRGTNLQQVDHLGRNALHLAVCTGNIQAIKLLLDSGVDPNVKDNVGMTPLSLSLMRRPSLLIANLLFDHGATILPRTSSLDSGLFIQFVMMCTPTTEEENILKLLVEKGAVINDPSAPGKRQALHFAAMSNNSRLIRLLISLGADVNMKNHRNETPIETASTFRCNEAYNHFCQLEEIEENTTSVSFNIIEEE